MSNFYISVNQFAEFSTATDSSRKNILKQQIKPNKLLIPWYQRAKAAIKRYFNNLNDQSPINQAIQELEKRVPTNKRQEIDKAVSIEALNLIKKIKLPRLLLYVDYEIVFVDDKDLSVNSVDIKVAPEILIKAKYRGETVYGAVKIHISKGKPFNLNQCSYVSTLLYKFVEAKIANSKEKVLPELCLCLDVFSERLVPAPSNLLNVFSEIKSICNEVKTHWPK